MPEKSEWKKLSKAETQAIAPIRADGQPDTYNYVPTRFITKEEAEARGWTHFYLGDVCSYGHKAPRFTSNPRHCVDCKRLREGRLTIGGKGEAEYVKRKRGAYSQPAERASGTAVVAAPSAPEPDPLERKFLTQYALLKDFRAAAKELGREPAYFEARLSYSLPFREAVEFLEDQSGLTRSVATTDDFEWSDDKRVVLIRTYVNTGDLAQAISAIGCSNWHYERELQDNQEFADTMAQVTAIAMKVIDRIAIGKAISGDSRLLQRVLTAKLPEYGERLKLDMTVTEKLTDEQLNERILLTFEQLGGRVVTSAPVIDAEFVELTPRRALEAPADAGNEASPAETEHNSDLL